MDTKVSEGTQGSDRKDAPVLKLQSVGATTVGCQESILLAEPGERHSYEGVAEIQRDEPRGVYRACARDEIHGQHRSTYAGQKRAEEVWNIRGE